MLALHIILVQRMSLKLPRRYIQNPEDIRITYDLVGIAADLNQLTRAWMRYDKKGQKANVNQIIKKLQSVKSAL